MYWSRLPSPGYHFDEFYQYFLCYFCFSVHSVQTNFLLLTCSFSRYVMYFYTAKVHPTWNAAINILSGFQYSSNFNSYIFSITTIAIHYYYTLMDFPSLSYQEDFSLTLNTNFLFLYFCGNQYLLHYSLNQFKFTFSCNTEGLY